MDEVLAHYIVLDRLSFFLCVGPATEENRKKKSRGTRIVPGSTIHSNGRNNLDCVTTGTTKQPSRVSHDNRKAVSGGDLMSTTEELGSVSNCQRQKTNGSISERGVAPPAESDSENDFILTQDKTTNVAGQGKARHRSFASSATDDIDDVVVAKTNDETPDPSRTVGRRTRSSSKKISTPEIVEIDSTDSEGEQEEDNELKVSPFHFNWVIY